MDISEYLNGETLTIEYKDDTYENFSDQKIYESAVAFANAQGGILLVGVTDKGEVKGSKRWADKYWKSTQSIEAMILQNTQPNLATNVSEVDHDGKKIIMVEVSQSATIVGTKSGRYLKRRLDQHGQPENTPMLPTEIAGGVATVAAMDFSTTHLSNCDISSIDIELVKKTAAELKRKAKLEGDSADESFFSQQPEDLLRSLGLTNNQNCPNVAGLLLFGTEEALKDRLPNAFVQYQLFGTKGEILGNERFSEPFVKLIPNLLSLKDLKRNSDEFIYRGSSVVIPEYSEEAIRETIANALVHRDYTFPNSIQIQVYPNELMVTSPGGFPRGVTMDTLLSVPPTPRNRRLAEALYRLKLVEASGRGIDFIFYGQARYGRPAPDYTASVPDRVSVRIAAGKANLDFCKLVLSLNDELTINQMLLLNAMFFNRDITIKEASMVIQRPIGQTNEILMSMHRSGLVEMLDKGEKKFFLKASISPFATKATAPKRLSAKEKRSYKDRIKESLDRRGEQSKDVLADAVGLSPSQCYRLLKELEKEGFVTTTPSKKWKAN